MDALVEGKYWRVHQISVITAFDPITFNTLPINEGLAIEKKVDEEHWAVAAFVKFNKTKKEIFLDPISFRLIEYLDDNTQAIDELKNCVDFAKHALLDINDMEGDER